MVCPDALTVLRRSFLDWAFEQERRLGLGEIAWCPPFPVCLTEAAGWRLVAELVG